MDKSRWVLEFNGQGIEGPLPPVLEIVNLVKVMFDVEVEETTGENSSWEKNKIFAVTVLGSVDSITNDFLIFKKCKISLKKINLEIAWFESARRVAVQDIAGMVDIICCCKLHFSEERQTTEGHCQYGFFCRQDEAIHLPKSFLLHRTEIRLLQCPIAALLCKDCGLEVAIKIFDICKSTPRGDFKLFLDEVLQFYGLNDKKQFICDRTIKSLDSWFNITSFDCGKPAELEYWELLKVQFDPAWKKELNIKKEANVAATSPEVAHSAEKQQQTMVPKKSGGAAVTMHMNSVPVMDHLIIQIRYLHDIKFDIKPHPIEDLVKQLRDYSIKSHEKDDLIMMYVKHRCSNPFGVKMPSEVETQFNPVPIVKFNDKHGQERIDVLFGIMQVAIYLPGNRSFPICWRAEEGYTRWEVSNEYLDIDTSKPSLKESNLEQWVRHVLQIERKAEKYVKVILELLEKQGVDNPMQLIGWDDDDWKVAVPPVALRGLLRQYTAELQSMELTQDDFAESEIYGFCHNIKRFFVYHASIILNDKLLILKVPFLDQRAIRKAVEEVAVFYKGDALLHEMEKEFLSFTVPGDIENVRTFRGVLLYGPPGTGKTTLTEKLPRRMGFTFVCAGISSAEVNRSYVGETEKLLQDLLNRPRFMPHLICGIAVDEIDGLAPKRDDKSSQSKNDALNMLLALVGGNKDVKNLVFMASTNRLKMMDSAFLRRMHAQFFVGRPLPSVREAMLGKIVASLDKRNCSPRVQELKQNVTANMPNLIKWTTNFSGAALDTLVSDLIVFITMVDTGFIQLTSRLTKKILLGMVHKVSEQFNMSIGAKSLAQIYNELEDHSADEALSSPGQHRISGKSPAALKGNPMVGKELISEELMSDAHSIFTGLVIADLKNGLLVLETKNDEYNRIDTDGPRNIDELLTICVNFSAKHQLDAIQLFDLDLLLANAAYDDSKKQEIIQEKIEEMEKYPTSIGIIDMDSLVGLNDGESFSSHGNSNNSSIFNQNMYGLMGSVIAKKNISLTDNGASGSSKKKGDQHLDRILASLRPASSEKRSVNKQTWIVVACNSPHIFKRVLKEKTDKITIYHKQEYEREQEEMERKRYCCLCRSTYTNQDNEKGLECTYHVGGLFNSSPPPGLMKPWKCCTHSELQASAAEHVDLRKRSTVAGDKNNGAENNIVTEMSKFHYACCMAQYSSGPIKNGCRKGKHVEHLTVDEVNDFKREYDECQRTLERLGISWR